MNTARLTSRSGYRSIRYSCNRQEKIHTADPSSAPKFRIKKNTNLDSTLMKTGYFQNTFSKTLPLIQNQQTTTNNQPIKSFISMINSQRKMNNQQKQYWTSKPNRFKILDFKQLEQSQFTLLDPIKRHIASTQAHIKQSEINLQEQKKEVNLLRGGLNVFKFQTLKQLQEFQDKTNNSLAKLRQCLKQNDTKQQQKKLKFKTQIQKLYSDQKQQVRESEQLLRQCQSLQMNIFSCKPFQLKQNQNQMENTASSIKLSRN